MANFNKAQRSIFMFKTILNTLMRINHHPNKLNILNKLSKLSRLKKALTILLQAFRKNNLPAFYLLAESINFLIKVWHQISIIIIIIFMF